MEDRRNVRGERIIDIVEVHRRIRCGSRQCDDDPGSRPEPGDMGEHAFEHRGRDRGGNRRRDGSFAKSRERAGFVRTGGGLGLLLDKRARRRRLVRSP